MMRLPWLLCWMPFAAALAANPATDHTERPNPRVELAKQIRIRQVIGLSEALGLTEAEALRMAQVIRSYQERRRPLQETVDWSSRIIRRAAEGDADAGAQLDQALQQSFSARAQLADLNRELFGVLSQGLTAQQRAKMAIFFARFEVQLQDA